MTSQVLLLCNIHKSIRNKQIIKGISFAINESEVLGFLGPNGAEKSTTLRMIVRLSSPTSGKILISNHNIAKDYVKLYLKLAAL